MTNSSTNPLAKHFRQPQLHIKLPSAGRWWNTGAIEIPVTGEIPIYAMTARDELTIKTPDALLNGQSTVDVIQSCCPSIKDAWAVPNVDLDALLIAIRIATYGNEMDFVSVCPHCGNKNEHTADLSYFMSNLSCPEWDKTIIIDDLEIFLKPQNFKDYNQSSMKMFEEQRTLQVLQDDKMDEAERLAKFRVLFDKLVNTTVAQLAKSVAAIKTADGTLVDDPKYIIEFFEQCDRPIWNAVKARIENLNDQNDLKKLKVTCQNDPCSKSYDSPLMFEFSSFFG